MIAAPLAVLLALAQDPLEYRPYVPHPRHDEVQAWLDGIRDEVVAGDVDAWFDAFDVDAHLPRVEAVLGRRVLRSERLELIALVRQLQRDVEGSVIATFSRAVRVQDVREDPASELLLAVVRKHPAGVPPQY